MFDRKGPAWRSRLVQVVLTSIGRVRPDLPGSLISSSIRLVIDAYVRVSLLGIELLTIDARIVVASVDTYLRFAEAVNRLDLQAQSRDLPEAVAEMQEAGSSRRKVKGAIEGAKEAFGVGENQEARAT